MKKVTVALVALLFAAIAVAPAFAQQSPVDEVQPIQFERPLPQVNDEEDDEEEPATVVAGQRLAETGLELTTGTALAAGLVIAGAGAVFLARRRSRVVEQ